MGGINLNALHVKNVSVKIDYFSLKNITFAVEQGTVCGLIGRNGAGKTSLLHTILDQVACKNGVIEYFNQGALTTELKQKIGVVWATNPFPPQKKIIDLKMFYASIYPNWDEAYFSKLCTQFQIDPQKKVRQLSTGQLANLQLILALSYHPDLLILDEPTAHLDPFTRDQVLQLLMNFMLHEKHSILMSSHYIDDFEKISDTILVLEDGEILFHETKDDLQSNYLIWRHTQQAARPFNTAAVISERKHALSTHYLLDKSLLTDTFLQQEESQLSVPSIEDYLLFMNYLPQEGEQY
jgi:ABC-2 type transport system ATP-binding protein